METELKFQVPPERRAALLRAVATAAARTTRLQAVYAETANLDLAAAGLALRLRKEKQAWVQTLKGRGDGLLNRLEHEVPLPTQRGVPTLNLQRHAGTEAGERLAAALPAGAQLQPLYRTDIQRLHRRVRTAGAVVEMAYDRGWLLAGEGAVRRRLAVNEIEFELVSGPPAALPTFARRWARRHGLWWDSRTKSERGLRLALGIQRVPAVPAEAAPRVRSQRAWRAALAIALAQLLPNAAELASGLGTPEHQLQLQRALNGLQALLRLPQSASWHVQAPLLAAAWAAWQARSGCRVTQPAFTTLLLDTLALALAAS